MGAARECLQAIGQQQSSDHSVRTAELSGGIGQVTGRRWLKDPNTRIQAKPRVESRCGHRERRDRADEPGVSRLAVH